MPEESTTPDLEHRVRSWIEAQDRRDFDELMSFYAPDVVWDGPTAGGMTFEGRAAVRGFLEEWVGSYEDYRLEIPEFHDVGGGVTWVVLEQRGRPRGTSGFVDFRLAVVATWTDGLIHRLTSYSDIDEARAAAERLAEERGAAVPAASPSVVELGRRAIGHFNAGDLDGVMELYAPDAVWQAAGGDLDGAERFEGRAAIQTFFEDWSGLLHEASILVEEMRDLGHGVGFARFVQRGRPLGSNGYVEFRYAVVDIWSDGLIQTTYGYTDASQALAAAERLAQERG
jgi:ketosteroid isomerase-like protein